MTKMTIAMLALCAAAAAAAQTPPATATPAQYYRLSFVLSYPHTNQPSQTLVLDTPVSDAQRGMSEVSSASGLLGVPNSVVQQKLDCMNVQRSAAGLAADVSFVSDVVSPPDATVEPRGNEPVHSRVEFKRSVDLVLGKPTVITQPLHRIVLNHGVATPMPDARGPIEPSPQITVTATAL